MVIQLNMLLIKEEGFTTLLDANINFVVSPGFTFMPSTSAAISFIVLPR
ncbi:MAG: hypothetical protein ACR5KV_07370 [Wolbachia sp.]